MNLAAHTDHGAAAAGLSRDFASAADPDMIRIRHIMEYIYEPKRTNL